MIDLNAIPHTYDDAVESLAKWHQADDIIVYHLPDPEKKIVRLVEVSQRFGDDEELRPIEMGESADFPFRSSVLLVSSADWDRVNREAKPMPTGWSITELADPFKHG
jgi:hypothetical protein